MTDCDYRVAGGFDATIVSSLVARGERTMGVGSAPYEKLWICRPLPMMVLSKVLNVQCEAPTLSRSPWSVHETVIQFPSR